MPGARPMRCCTSVRASAWQAIQPARAGSEQSRWACAAAVPAEGPAAAEATDGAAKASIPPEIRATVESKAVVPRRLSRAARRDRALRNELPSMGG